MENISPLEAAGRRVMDNSSSLKDIGHVTPQEGLLDGLLNEEDCRASSGKLRSRIKYPVYDKGCQSE